MQFGFALLVVIPALIISLTNLGKDALAGKWAVVFMQVISWIIGIGVAFLVRASDWADTFLIGTGEDALPLGTLNPFSVVLVGVAFAATANLAYTVLPNTNTPNPFLPSQPETQHPGTTNDDPDVLEAGELPEWVEAP